MKLAKGAGELTMKGLGGNSIVSLRTKKALSLGRCSTIASFRTKLSAKVFKQQVKFEFGKMPGLMTCAITLQALMVADPRNREEDSSHPRRNLIIRRRMVSMFKRTRGLLWEAFVRAILLPSSMCKKSDGRIVSGFLGVSSRSSRNSNGMKKEGSMFACTKKWQRLQYHSKLAVP